MATEEGQKERVSFLLLGFISEMGNDFTEGAALIFAIQPIDDIQANGYKQRLFI